MAESTSQGLGVIVSISDPWEFGTECGTAPFVATVERMEDEVVLLTLGRELAFKGMRFDRLLAYARHKSPSINDLHFRLVPVHFVPVAVSTAVDSLSEAVQNWRGWWLLGALTGSPTSSTDEPSG